MPAATPWTDWIVAAALLGGGFFLFVAGLGILRLPDVLIRMHASTKAGTLGAGLIFLAVAVQFRDATSISLSLLTIVFLLVTVPVGAHAIARVAYRIRVPLWRQTHIDEWRQQYAAERAQRETGQ